MGRFASDFTIEAVNGDGNVVQTEVVKTAGWQTLKIVTPKSERISALHFTGGGHEGIIRWICIEVAVGK